jgi:hypothetical protein
MQDDLDWLHTHMWADPFNYRDFSHNDRKLWYDWHNDDYLSARSWDFWYDYQNDLQRTREEKINELFGIGKETLKDIWPE